MTAFTLRLGGTLSVTAPWSLASLCNHDGRGSHDLEDIGAGLLGDAVWEPLYVQDVGGLECWLADGLPEARGGATYVRLTPGRVFSDGQPVDARAVVASLVDALGASAREGSAPWAAGWLSAPVVSASHELRFAESDARRVAERLASPLLAVRGRNGVGSGPMRIVSAGGQPTEVVLGKNPTSAELAASDRIVLRSGTVAESLRRFEAGADTFAWGARGLHESRAGARTVDGGILGWVVLATGKVAGTWDSAGVAQSLCDGLRPDGLKRFSLGDPWPRVGDGRWGGPPTELLVRSGHPWLEDLGETLAAFLSSPGHDVTLRPVHNAEYILRRRHRDYGLLLTAVRPVARTLHGLHVALAAMDQPRMAEEVARRPPRYANARHRTLGRTLRAGIVGEVRVGGGVDGRAALAVHPYGGVDWAASVGVQ